MGTSLLGGFTACQADGPRNRKLLGYVRTNWSKDPYSHGSYSIFTHGSDRGLLKPLASPLMDRVFFAGEAMHPEYNTTVHAALESGQMTGEVVKQSGARNIAIIGAGVSGLAAAQQLADNGRDVIVYEARDRIGGRIWTDRSQGLALELGASWIHGVKGNPLSGLADMHDIDRVKNSRDLAVRGGDGRKIPSSFAPGWLDTIADVQNSFGMDPALINHDAYEKGDGYKGHDVIFPKGYDQILKSLSGMYFLSQNTPITSVVYSSDKVTLHNKRGATSDYDAVIVTVPLGVLKRRTISFDPPLPEEKQQAIDRLGMGTLDKLYLLFDNVFWDDTTFIATPENGLPRGHFNDWMTFHKTHNAPVIQAFNGGPAALALAKDDDETVLEKALATLKGAYPD